jgi:hypothetical protein
MPHASFRRGKNFFTSDNFAGAAGSDSETILRA